MSDSPVHLSLSAKGLQRLERVNHESNFAFVVGDERYSCPSFVAEFLSPRMLSLRSQDITINEFSIETADPQHYFGHLLSIAFGHHLSLNQDKQTFVRSVCGELGNWELFGQTLTQDERKIAESDLKSGWQLLWATPGNCDFDVSVIASNFHAVTVSDFDHCSVSVLEKILSHSRLVARDEDSIFEGVHRRASADLSYICISDFWNSFDSNSFRPHVWNERLNSFRLF
jgi:hypothetical protein